MKKYSKIILSVATVVFIGCGGGGSSSSKENIIKGKVADGYVKNAIVCADLNKNFKCDPNEPTDISDKNGNYSLKTASKDYILISQGGIDTQSNSKAPTMYSLPKYKNITPLTSLAVKKGEKAVADYFNINESQIGADPVKNNEIQNIVKNIIDTLEITGKYQITTSHILVDTKPGVKTNNSKTQNIDTNSTKNINTKPEVKTNNSKTQNTEINSTKNTDINKTNGNNNIPPQIAGNLTPPKIGE